MVKEFGGNVFMTEEVIRIKNLELNVINVFFGYLKC